jgi:hypothetical protein
MLFPKVKITRSDLVNKSEKAIEAYKRGPNF